MVAEVLDRFRGHKGFYLIAFAPKQTTMNP
jgi:hypothetical protein